MNKTVYQAFALNLNLPISQIYARSSLLLLLEQFCLLTIVVQQKKKSQACRNQNLRLIRSSLPECCIIVPRANTHYALDNSQPTRTNKTSNYDYLLRTRVGAAAYLNERKKKKTLVNCKFSFSSSRFFNIVTIFLISNQKNQR